MRAIIPTVLMMLASLISFASPSTPITTGDDCRETVIYDNFSLSTTSKVEKDLMSGVWTYGRINEETISVYRFQDYGMLEIIQIAASGEAEYESFLWRVDEYNNQAFLVLTTSDFKHEKLFQTLPTCQGMVLLDPVSIDQVNLTYNEDMGDHQLNYLSTRLQGTWESATYPYDLTDSFDDCGTFEPIEGAYLKYHFNEDGTFVKHYGSHMAQLEQRGFYEIFQEQFIVFHVEGVDGNYSQHVARIKYLDYGEMVLEQTLESDDFADFFCSELKSVSFIQ